jgi:CIC family chloride channel protein
VRLDAEDHLVGIITRGDVLRALDNGEQEKTVLEAGSDTLVTAYPEETVHAAINQMLEYNIGRLPVVNRDDPQRLIGYVGRSSVMQARSQRLEEEARREPGWISHFRSASTTRSATNAR